MGSEMCIRDSNKRNESHSLAKKKQSGSGIHLNFLVLLQVIISLRTLGQEKILDTAQRFQ